MGGGARVTDGASLTVRNSVFVGNDAFRGGAIYADAGANLTVGTTIFAHNIARATAVPMYKNVRMSSATNLAPSSSNCSFAVMGDYFGGCAIAETFAWPVVQ